jgi:hydrogenase nickel incorporation protein HypB
VVGVIKASEGEVFDIELEKSLLDANLTIAIANKKRLDAFNIKVFDIMGAIGSGKTTLVKNIVHILKDQYRIAAIDGDVTTSIDADLIAEEGIDVVQINTGKECHLDANLVKKAIDKFDLENLDLIFIENVGNLICPAEFPLGADKRMVVISVTEGPYMIRKHPHMFIGADIVVINKIDLAQVMGVEVARLESDVKAINPKAIVIPTSCKEAIGLQKVISAIDL